MTMPAIVTMTELAVAGPMSENVAEAPLACFGLKLAATKLVSRPSVTLPPRYFPAVITSMPENSACVPLVQ